MVRMKASKTSRDKNQSSEWDGKEKRWGLSERKGMKLRGGRIWREIVKETGEEEEKDDDNDDDEEEEWTKRA